MIRLRNSSSVIPERISSNKFPSVNLRATTVCGGFDVEEGGVFIGESVDVETRVDWLSDWGKRKENSRFKYLFGARISTDEAGTLERKVKKYEVSRT